MGLRRSITPANQQTLQERLPAAFGDVRVYLERGFQRSDTIVVAIAISVTGLLFLVATLIATALSQADGLPMMGTLAAVGATRLTRRSFAAAQASTLAPTIVIPWLQLAIPLVAIPVLAATLAWVSILTAPAVSRRLPRPLPIAQGPRSRFSPGSAPRARARFDPRSSIVVGPCPPTTSPIGTRRTSWPR